MKKPTKDKTNRRTISYYWRAYMKYPFLTWMTIAFTPIVIAVRTTVIPLVFAEIIDIVSNQNGDLDSLILLILPKAIVLLILYFAVDVVMGLLRVYMLWKVELKVNYDLATECFNVISAQSMQFHKERFTGSIVSQVNKFVDASEDLFDQIVFDIIPIITTITGVLIVLFQRAPYFALVLLVFIIVYIAIAYLASKNVIILNKKQASAVNKQSGQLSDSISNILSVKSYGRETHERRRYAGYSRATFDARKAVMNAWVKREVVFDGMWMIVIAAILVFLTVGQPVFGLAVSTLILIVNYTMTVMDKLYDVNNLFRHLSRVFSNAHEMTQILDTENLVVDKRGAKELEVKKGRIKFENIKFKHADAKDAIFNEFNLDIKAGERIGLVGLSGSGKTTLTKLLLRFSDVEEGEILIDGQNISNVRQVSLRESIAYVPQETALFNRTIAENIAYAKPDASQEEIERAAILAHADEFIDRMPEGYATMVGEHGSKLSGGQRQRVAIARAILKDAPILVLDEATSALDSESEALIQDALEKLMKGRTSIAVAHRLSTIASMDRIVVLENGKILEQGSHEELLKKKGAYAHLWSRQSGGVIEGDD